MLPVAFDNRGDGHGCLTGNKILGMQPITEAQKEELAEQRRECWEFKKMQEQTLQAGLSFGSGVAGAIGSFAGGSNPFSKSK